MLTKIIHGIIVIESLYAKRLHITFWFQLLAYKTCFNYLQLYQLIKTKSMCLPQFCSSDLSMQSYFPSHMRCSGTHPRSHPRRFDREQLYMSHLWSPSSHSTNNHSYIYLFLFFFIYHLSTGLYLSSCQQ